MELSLPMSPLLGVVAGQKVSHTHHTPHAMKPNVREIRHSQADEGEVFRYVLGLLEMSAYLLDDGGMEGIPNTVARHILLHTHTQLESAHPPQDPIGVRDDAALSTPRGIARGSDAVRGWPRMSLTIPGRG